MNMWKQITILTFMIFFICFYLQLNKVDETKPTKPLDNMTYAEAVFYTRAFEDGYDTRLLEIIKYTSETNRSSTEIMRYLITEAEKIRREEPRVGFTVDTDTNRLNKEIR